MNNVLLLIIVLVLCVLLIFIFFYILWRNKNKWGVNPKRITCPHCNKPLPFIRKPKNMRQAFWGGSTCPYCGTEVDKWGREVKKS
jgi:uncharacterized protein YggT (Ycf19 family)